MKKAKDINIGFFLCKSLLLILLLLPTHLLFAKNKYWIQAELLPAQRSIVGNIEMTYLNTSNDTLQEIWIHLYPNAYQSLNTPFAKQLVQLNLLEFQYGKKFGKIDSLNFIQNGKKLTVVSSDDSPDVIVVLLDKPLLPHTSIAIQTPFRVKLPFMVSRSGYSGSFYAATQWYPKFAVYENGEWQAMSYKEQGEFYSDFADYDVSVKLPSAYQFAATGYKYQAIDSSQNSIEYHVKILNVHDFAWFASRKFQVLQEELKLPSGRSVMIQAYGDSLARVQNMLDYTHGTILYLSQHLGEYPYDVCTIVQGNNGLGSGMEYPTISNVEGDIHLLLEVVHEVTHNWWYGILANNERKEPFLDESVTSYYESRILNEIFPSEYKRFQWFKNISNYIGLNRMPEDLSRKNMVLYQYRNNLQQATNLNSEQYSQLNYLAMIYVKGSTDIQNLEEYIGKDLFDSIMKSFFDKYKFQHISLNSLAGHFKSHSSKDVSWFFDELLTNPVLYDVSVKKILMEEGRINVDLYNKRGTPVAVNVALVNKNLDILQSQYVLFSEKNESVIFEKVPNAYAVLIDPKWITPEKNRKNNFAKISGMKSWKPLQIRALGALEDPTKNQLFFIPTLAGNQYDGFMFGAALYNSIFPIKKFAFELIPFYAFKSKQFNWIGNMNYLITPVSQKPVQIEIGVHSKSFSKNNRPIEMRYFKLQPYIEAYFRPLDNDLGPHHRVGYRNVQIWDENYLSNKDSISGKLDFYKTKGHYNTHEIWYDLKYSHALFPMEMKTVLRFDDNYIRHSLAYKQKFRYTEKGAFVHVRLFAGAFYYHNENVSFRKNAVVGFNMSGINGRNDYLYDGNYFGRNSQSGLSSQQLMMGEGNFKVLTALQNPMEGKTVNTLLAVNFKIDAPVKWLPIQFFTDFGYRVDKVLSPDNFLPSKEFYYDLGFNISLLNEGLEIYFPLLMPNNFKSYYKSNLPKFGQRISFSLDIGKLRPSQMLKDGIIQKYF
ncbi:MAG: M1 family metallopeptidase [Chitinophagales bacterium]|nr:M1 family metallopeptidase [Chitinophagales bacterium]MCZ2393604.1 M1 family metallopeptidase [Chitinophagales bacterium]